MTEGTQLWDIIGKIAWAMDEGLIGPGDRAELRRLNPASPDRAVFWRVMAQYGPADHELSEEEERRWAIVLSGMARLPHQQGRRLGRVLAEAGFPEQRLEHLLRAEGVKELAPAVRRLAQFLKAKNQPIDWCALAGLILAADPEKIERARRAIARDYYRHPKKEENVS